MKSRRTVIAFVLGLALVTQGFAFAQSTVVAPVAATSMAGGMPCHHGDAGRAPCCGSDFGCPDMLCCLLAHAVASPLAGFALAVGPDATAPRRTSFLHAVSRPASHFRPPIVVHA